MIIYIVNIVIGHSIKSWVDEREKYCFFKSKENAEKYINNRILDEINKVKLKDMPDNLKEYLIDGKLNEAYINSYQSTDDLRDYYDSLNIPCYLIYGYIDVCDTDDIQ